MDTQNDITEAVADLIDGIEVNERGVPLFNATQNIKHPFPEFDGDALVVDDMDDREYHATEGFNASTGKKFVESGWDGAATMDPRYPEGQEKDPNEISNSILLGRAAHVRVFEPERYFEQAIIGLDYKAKQPKTEKGAKKYLADGCNWERHQLAEIKHPENIILHETWDERIEGIHDAVMEHPQFHKMFLEDGCRNEVSVFWYEETTINGRKFRIPCKMRMDRFNPKMQLIGDLKVTGKGVREHEFARSNREFGYYMSGAFYTRGAIKEGLMDKFHAMPYVMLAVSDAPLVKGCLKHISNMFAPNKEQLEMGYDKLIMYGMRRWFVYRTLGVAEGPDWANKSYALYPMDWEMPKDQHGQPDHNWTPTYRIDA